MSSKDSLKNKERYIEDSSQEKESNSKATKEENTSQEVNSQESCQVKGQEEALDRVEAENEVEAKALGSPPATDHRKGSKGVPVDQRALTATGRPAQKRTTKEGSKKPGPPKGCPSPNPGKPRNQAKIQFEDKLQIFNDYWVDKMSETEIAKKWGISQPYVNRILKSQELQDLAKTRQKAAIQSMQDAMMKNTPTINSILEDYLQQATDPERVEKTSLPGLFTTYGIIIDKQLKLEEIALKREELRVRALEAQKAASANQGLIGDFMQVIQSGSTLPPRTPASDANSGLTEANTGKPEKQKKNPG